MNSPLQMERKIQRLEKENASLRAVLSRILKATPHSMCSDAEAWVLAERVVSEGK
jgi:hypothetical protein